MKALLLTLVLLLATHAYASYVTFNLDEAKHASCNVLTNADGCNFQGSSFNAQDVLFTANSSNSYLVQIMGGTNMSSLTVSPYSNANVTITVSTFFANSLIINPGASIQAKGTLVVAQLATINGTFVAHNNTLLGGLSLGRAGILYIEENTAVTVNGTIYVNGSILATNTSSLTFNAATIYIDAESILVGANIVLANSTYVWSQNGVFAVQNLLVTGKNNTISAAPSLPLHVLASTVTVSEYADLLVTAILTVNVSAVVNGSLSIGLYNNGSPSYSGGMISTASSNIVVAPLATLTLNEEA